jgi:UDP-N-acetylglucosamine--N-acetylmuramyl-(pentapeptide) pyrophosphoryl-undecaprenol N-acetylglucosamine transferase
MRDGGAAIVIEDAALTPERLRAEVDAILVEPDRLAAMAAAASRLARPDAARDVARAVLAAARPSAD